MKQSKYFSIKEFESKDGAEMPESVKKNISELMQNMDVIRETIGKPIYVNSGYRSVQHNANVGGKTNSYHTLGMACDFHVKGLSPIFIKNVVENLIAKGKIKKGGIGLYSTFLHYDIRGFNARWNG